MSTSDTVAGAAIDARGNPQAWNMRLVGHCPMEGRGDGMHINLKDGYAFFRLMCIPSPRPSIGQWPTSRMFQALSLIHI